MKITKSFFFMALAFKASLAFSEEKPPEILTPLNRPTWVTDWKDIKALSYKDRMAACDKLSKLSWNQEFPFPQVIKERESWLCRMPPDISTPDFANLLKSSQFYRSDFDTVRAQSFLNKALKKAKTTSQKIQAWEEQLKLDRSSQDKKKRLRSALKLKQLNPDRFLVDYARSLWTYDQTSKAQAVLKQAPKLFKKSTSQQEVLFVLGRIEEEKKRPLVALSFYDRALKEPKVSTEVLAKLLAFAAWVNFQQGEYALSIDFWNQLYEQSPERFTQSRALYWRAICEKRLKKIPEAQKTFQQIIDEDPVSYYTLLAQRELKIKLEPLKPFKEDSKSFEKLKILTDSEKQLLNWLVAFDEKEMTENLLVSHWEDGLKANDSEQEAYFQYFWKLGLTNALVRNLNQLPADKRIVLTKKHQAALFPYHFEEEIKVTSMEESLNPYFVMALIRQESAFNPEARSPTDAVGLMQVMPSLAKKIAKEKNLKYTQTSELYSPLLNLQIGTRELKDRLKDFDMNQTLAAASYNAGVGAVKGWLKTRKTEDPVEFIEAIPYEETRGYVRLIIRNQLFYQRLFSAEAFLFPEEILTRGW